MKNKKLADWTLNDKRYQIVEKPHTIFNTEVIIRELVASKEKKKKTEEEDE